MKVEITPERVVEAYKRTGLVPSFGTWGNAVTCGCALTAIACDLNPSFKDTVKQDGGFVNTTLISEQLDMSDIKVDSFIRGFDVERPTEIYPKMYELGLDCRIAVQQWWRRKEDENN